MKQLKVYTNDLSSVVKKKVVAAAVSVSSTEAFPTAGLALQLEVPTMAASIPGQKVGEEYMNVSCFPVVVLDGCIDQDFGKIKFRT
jgi:hypothetical protein